jgi:transcriptional regulator with XRE-family HTH domain
MSNYEPTAFYRELTARVRGHLARFDINQVDLAVLCDVSQSQMSKILRGLRPMTLDQLAVICDAVELDIVSLARDAWKFAQARELIPSPVHIVVDEEREPDPIVGDEQWLDGWGIAARKRILQQRQDNVVEGNFGSRQRDAVRALVEDDEPSIKQPPARRADAAKKGTRKADDAPHAE